jgi:hypothetical protein
MVMDPHIRQDRPRTKKTGRSLSLKRSVIHLFSVCKNFDQNEIKKAVPSPE